MHALVLIPTLLVTWTAQKRSFREAWLFVLLPCLLLLPNYFTWKLPGIPLFSFHNYAVLVIGIAMLGSRDRSLYRFRALDLVVAFHVLWMIASEYENKGFAEAQNLGFLRGIAIGVPYLVGRVISRHNGLLVSTLIMMTLVGALIGLTAPFEWRMGTNPYDFWRRWWPGAPWDGALYRLGGRRVAGPFAHPICHGFFFSMLVPLTSWLFATKLWNWPRRWQRILPLATVIGVFLGLAAPMSRGPIAGAMLGLGVMRFGWFQNRGLALSICGFGLVAFLVLFLDSILSYISVTRGEATTEAQETAAYRNEMLQLYQEIVDQRPVWGWGKDGFPVLKGMISIDNQYLFLSLSHGYAAAWSFLLTMLLPALVLLGRLARRNPSDPLGRLGWAFAGLLLGAIFTQTTVFAGTQTVEILFLLIGCSVTLGDRLKLEPETL